MSAATDHLRITRPHPRLRRVPRLRSVPLWAGFAKRQLANFATVHQDGDDEGVLILSRLPDKDEAETLRHYIGLRQTREVSPRRSKASKTPIGRAVQPSTSPKTVGLLFISPDRQSRCERAPFNCG